MRLTNHDLKQISQEYLASLTGEQLLKLSGKMLADLREARDRENQTPQNSSRPSGSYAPWEQEKFGKAKSEREKGSGEEPKKAIESELPKREGDEEKAKKGGGSKRKAGKQKGSKGVGRRVELEITGEKLHKAVECGGCGGQFAEEGLFEAKTGLYVLDIEREAHGIQISHVKHIYGERHCECGHRTQTMPGRCEDEEGWQVGLTEWHLVGATLASLIICLALRMRLSRARIREFLHDWLGITLSIGCINQCIAEGGRAVAPLEAELIAEIQAAELLHADETGWKENGRTVWLWVLRTATVTLYLIGRRSWDVIADVMEQFSGWLMSDGYGQYRQYAQRLRCLAHLIRKMRGLAESCHPEAAQFGHDLLKTTSLFINGIYEARGDPTIDLPERFSDQLVQLRERCLHYRDHEHPKTKALARELTNDWDAIWTVLQHPELPITNNVAERSLRHWVIARKLSHGTRTRQGSRAYTALASVIDTCRQRDISPWPYLAHVIAQRRQGLPVPSFPLSVC